MTHDDSQQRLQAIEDAVGGTENPERGDAMKDALDGIARRLARLRQAVAGALDGRARQRPRADTPAAG